MENTQFLHLLNGMSEPDPGPVPEGWDIRTHQITQRIARTLRESCEPFLLEPIDHERNRIVMMEHYTNALKKYYYNGEVRDISYDISEDAEGNMVGRVTVVPFEMLQKVYIDIKLS